MTDSLVIEASHERDGARIAVLTLNRPDQRNPLDHDTIHALTESIDRIVVDTTTRVVVITGAGSAFSAGGDLKKYQDLYRDRDRFECFLGDFATLCDRLERAPFVSVAMVNGTCVAGGLELVLACDLVVMSEDATIGDGHLRFGQLPGAGGSQRLVRAIGPARARAWILSGRLYSAAEAATSGLVADVWPRSELEARTLELASVISRHSPLAVRRARELLALADSETLTDRLEQERRIVHEYATSSFDATEGLMAFAEKRPAHYRGE
jgi:enoyl-CoA hydratase